MQSERARAARDAENSERVGFMEPSEYDGDMPSAPDMFATSISTMDEDGDDDASEFERGSRSGTAVQNLVNKVRLQGEEEDPFSAHKPKTIRDRESDYQLQRFNRIISPERSDPFAMDATPRPHDRTYADVMQDSMVENEQKLVLRKIQQKQQEEQDNKEPGTRSDDEVSVASESRWDATPTRPDATPGDTRWDDEGTPARKKSRWDQTPGAATGRRKSRWDETPTQIAGIGPDAATPNFAAMATPARAMATPSPAQLAAMTPDQRQRFRWERDLDERNRPLTDEDLDVMLPTEGYKVLEPPATYQPVRTPSRRIFSTPTPMTGMTGFSIPLEEKAVSAQDLGIPVLADESLPSLKPEDEAHFSKLMQDVDESQLDADARKERAIMKLLLRIKNGTPPMRKTALRQITDKAREFGPAPLFNQILPLLMSPTLEDQERHFLVKVIDRILYKLDDLVRPYVHKILVVIEPLLIDEDYYARVEGREIISNLAKAAGLASMISVMRPDIDNVDEYVRNITARAFAVVASALGIPSLLPFLKAVCRSKKSWQARHTGIKIVQQVAVLMGCAVLPHLRNLVNIIEHGLQDNEPKVKTITALALAALAESSAPYGIESFDRVLLPLYHGINQQRSKALAAFLKAVGFIIPLMDPDAAIYYTKYVCVTRTLL